MKDFILSLPVIGYGFRIIKNIVKLPRINDRLLAQHDQLERIRSDIEVHQKEIIAALEEDAGRIKAIQKTEDSLQQQIMLMDRRLEAGRDKRQNGAAKGEKELLADDHMLDMFYTGFEDRFRGAEDMIRERQEEYLPYFKSSKLNFKDCPVLDIGCGRGELLQLLQNNNIRAIGLDLNIDMVNRAKQKGLEAVEGDALEFLQKSKLRSYGAITGFHLVEHIPFNVLFRFFVAAHGALAEGGFVIFETPNPENVLVSSLTFYLDPSHLHPLPPDLLAFALETCGFRNVEIKRLHPDETYKGQKLPADVMKKFYGPRDYAVIAYK